MDFTRASKKHNNANYKIIKICKNTMNPNNNLSSAACKMPSDTPLVSIGSTSISEVRPLNNSLLSQLPEVHFLMFIQYSKNSYNLQKCIQRDLNTNLSPVY